MEDEPWKKASRERRAWPGAVTVIPNYLITGVTAIVMVACIVFWTVFYICKRMGPAVFLILSVLLIAVGSGIAHIPFFLIGWARTG